MEPALATAVKQISRKASTGEKQSPWAPGLKAMSEKPKAPPMEIQPGSSGWRHMPSPMGSFASVKPKAALAPLAAEVRQAAETARCDALKKQRNQLVETLRRKR